MAVIELGGCAICSRPPSEGVTVTSLDDGLLVECPVRPCRLLAHHFFERMSPEMRGAFVMCDAAGIRGRTQQLRVTKANAKDHGGLAPQDAGGR